MIKHSTIQYCTCLGIPVGHTGHTSNTNTFKIWPTQLYNAWYTNSHPCAYVFGPHCFCACKCQRRVPKSNFQTSASEKRAGISKKNKNVARFARHNTSPTYCTRYIDASFNPSRKRNLKPCWWELPCSTISLGQPMISDLRPLHLHWKLLSDKIFFPDGSCWSVLGVPGVDSPKTPAPQQTPKLIHSWCDSFKAQETRTSWRTEEVKAIWKPLLKAKCRTPFNATTAIACQPIHYNRLIAISPARICAWHSESSASAARQPSTITDSSWIVH